VRILIHDTTKGDVVLTTQHKLESVLNVWHCPFCCIMGALFRPDDGGSTSFRNVGELSGYTVPYTRRYHVHHHAYLKCHISELCVIPKLTSDEKYLHRSLNF
jgi:hypothetical protein